LVFKHPAWGGTGDEKFIRLLHHLPKKNYRRNSIPIISITGDDKKKKAHPKNQMSF
jgi:hypothetical protein